MLFGSFNFALKSKPKAIKKKLSHAVALATVFSCASSTAFAAEGNPRVNQVGYIPNAPKIATYATNATSSQPWELRKGSAVVASGVSIPKGFDSASGDNVHHIDFSNVEADGSDYRLFIGADQSYPFEISSDLYSDITFDAIKYFYHNRSGIAIETQFTGGGSYGNDAKYSRPAGHLNQGANKGDFNVSCWPGTCDYSLDVPYGWYDAGDHGKYVVNGGISVWKLANMYERATHLGNNANKFADNTLNIPESGNGVADILDEIRWQMRFMLAMQVPEGKPKAGMVHHKMHDFGWTGIPLAPHSDSNTRHLVPPSTAATLNLAATGAQCARLWQNIDASFANSCLTGAEKAWNAAKQNPNITLPDKPYNNGGGSYGDTRLSDEFLWAAVELYITTGNNKYLADINLSSIDRTDYNWADVDIPALISLATVTTPHTNSLMAEARQRLISIADGRLATLHSKAHFTPVRDDEFVWGSNNNIANILTILAIAYDVTGNEAYAEGVGLGLNYLFGQNALSLSYITGHGENASAQPHHRFWAGASNNAFPWAPPGSLAGGPNVGLQDDLSKSKLDGCQTQPQTCYLDDIDAWSTNEITINWNSALAWVVAFYDDYANSGSADPKATIVTPSNNQKFLPGQTIDISVDASDRDGQITSVELMVNSTVQASDSTAPYTFSLNSQPEGFYQLSARVTDNDGNTTTSSTVTVEVGENEPPVAAFTNNTNGLSASFNASNSSDPDGNIVSYEWDFGDGAQGSGETTSHTYVMEGTYDVQLAVTDNASASHTITQTVSVTAPPPIKCSIGNMHIWNNGASLNNITVSNLGSSALHGWAVSLNAGVPVSVTNFWNADSVTADGSTITANGSATLQPGQSTSFDFLISHGGNFSNATCTGGGITTTNHAPSASFTVSTSGLTVTLDGTGSTDVDGDSLTYHWQFGDGQESIGATATHTYAIADTYPVTLTVNDGKLDDSEQMSITVNEPCGNCPQWAEKIEAESFTQMSGVQTEPTSDDGGLNVGWIDAGDWMVFPTVNLPTTGSYLIEYRVASLNGGGQIQFEEGGGSPVYGNIDVPSTSGWQNWTTIDQTVNLTAGPHNLAIAAPSGGFNINWIRITLKP